MAGAVSEDSCSGHRRDDGDYVYTRVSPTEHIHSETSVPDDVVLNLMSALLSVIDCPKHWLPFCVFPYTCSFCAHFDPLRA